ncbi:MAG TPA: enoyl-CoA hydratase-related protein [Anaerolineae bacterium]
MQNIYQFVRYEKKGHLAYVTLNRPKVLNALHPPLTQELSDVWTDFAHDSEMWVAILTGSGGRAFSAGADLKYRTTEADEQALRHPQPPRRHILDRCYKPVIAAINGYAVGGGLELALRCDILIAAEHAQLGLPEPRRGLLADEGGVIKLPRRLPYHLAMGLVLTGKLISAQEAYRIGLVNAVVPMNELMPAAERWAAEVLECGPLAIQAAKQIILETRDLSEIDAANRVESLEAVRRMRESQDYAEGPRAFAEKRKPVWQAK